MSGSRVSIGEFRRLTTITGVDGKGQNRKNPNVPSRESLESGARCREALGEELKPTWGETSVIWKGGTPFSVRRILIGLCVQRMTTRLSKEHKANTAEYIMMIASIRFTPASWSSLHNAPL